MVVAITLRYIYIYIYGHRTHTRFILVLVSCFFVFTSCLDHSFWYIFFFSVFAIAVPVRRRCRCLRYTIADYVFSNNSILIHRARIQATVIGCQIGARVRKRISRSYTHNTIELLIGWSYGRCRTNRVGAFCLWLAFRMYMPFSCSLISRVQVCMCDCWYVEMFVYVSVWNFQCDFGTIFLVEVDSTQFSFFFFFLYLFCYFY